MRQTRPGCCARAASGHETADPTILVMKSRRRITLPSLGYRQFRLPTHAHQYRNLRPAKCDEMVSLHCINLELLMTEMGQRRRSSAVQQCPRLPPIAGIRLIPNDCRLVP